MGRPTIIERASKYVEAMPAAVSGSKGHNATFAVACALVKGFNLSADQARSILQEFNRRCDPPWTERDLEHKLLQAERTADPQTRGYLIGDGQHEVGAGGNRSSGAAPYVPRVAPRAEYDPGALAEFAGNWAQEVDLVWLANRSVVDPALVPTDDFLAALYPPGEHVVLFTDERSQGQAMWPEELAPSTGRLGVWFLAQPVDGQYHPNPRQGKTSRRSEESVTSWRYLLLESDDAPVRPWLGALVQLPLRIVAIYTSGGRSVHALVRVDARTKMEWDDIKTEMAAGLRFLIKNGADRGVLTAVRLTRLPGTFREGKMLKQETGPDVYKRFDRPQLQKLLYLNPNPDPKIPRALKDILPRRGVAAEWLARAAAEATSSPSQTLRSGLAYYAPVHAGIRTVLQQRRGGRP